MKKPEVGILVRKSLRERIISHNDLTKLGEFYNIKMNPFDRDLSANEVCQFLEGMTGAISSWGTVQITNSILRCTSNLKILAHAAGSIKNIVSDEVWERGLIVTWKKDGGYDVQYWYETPDNIVPAELKADGTSKGKSVKKAIK